LWMASKTSWARVLIRPSKISSIGFPYKVGGGTSDRLNTTIKICLEMP
jgi:hypothetical protein